MLERDRSQSRLPLGPYSAALPSHGARPSLSCDNTCQPDRKASPSAAKLELSILTEKQKPAWTTGRMHGRQAGTATTAYPERIEISLLPNER